MILSRSAKVAYSSARARQILHLASGEWGARAGARRRIGPAAALQSVYDRLVCIFEERAAPPPVVEDRNPAGRFIYRAHWLDSERAGEAALVAVTVQHQEPVPLVMLRKLHAAGLSARQKEVALLLASGRSFDEIATTLHISHATAKDYAQRIYRKVNVHSKEELMRVMC